MAAADCPELEDIAAFLDGKLTAEEQERITEHLASCESCYQDYAGTAHYLEASREAGEQPSLPALPLPEEVWEEPDRPPAVAAPMPPRPFEGRRKPGAPRRRTWWAAAALAASLAVVTGVLLLRWLSPGHLTTERLASLAASPQAIGQVPWGKVTRGAGESREAPIDVASFRLGVRLVDVRLALAGDKRDASETSLIFLSKLLPDLELLGSHEREAIAAMLARLRQGAPPRSLLADAATWERKAIEDLVVDPRLVEAGGWTEACRLAGAGGRPDLFRQPATLRILDRAIAGPSRDDEGTLGPQAIKVLRGIRAEIAAGRVDPAALANRCQGLLELLDPD